MSNLSLEALASALNRRSSFAPWFQIQTLLLRRDEDSRRLSAAREELLFFACLMPWAATRQLALERARKGHGSDLFACLFLRCRQSKRVEPLFSDLRSDEITR